MKDSDSSVTANRGLVLNFPITKIDKELREVWGVATSEALDQQGEVVDYDASKVAFEDWTETINRATGGLSLGNVREMHGPKAVGKLIAYQPDDEKRHIWVGVKLSESADGEDAWKKVNEGVLTGFSIGAPFAERQIQYRHGSEKPVTRVTNYKLSELSLVDNPACPDSFFQEVKLAKRGGVEVAYSNVLDFFVPIAKAADRDEWISRRIVAAFGYEGEKLDQGAAIAHSMAEGRFDKLSKENAMDEKMEKGKKIGPNTRTAADPAGAQRPTLPSLAPMPPGPSPAKSAGEKDASVEGLNSGRVGGPHDIASDEMTVPEGQGKVAEADATAVADADASGANPMGSDRPTEHAPAGTPGHTAPPGMTPIPPARKEIEDIEEESQGRMPFNYCAYCGSKMASAGTNPFHAECKSASLMKSATFRNSELAKMIRGQADSLTKMATALEKANSLNEELLKRVEKIEKTPLPGGPMRTELPQGVQAVEKGAGASSPNPDLDRVTLLEKAMAATGDAHTRDLLSREVAKSMMKRQFKSMG